MRPLHRGAWKAKFCGGGRKARNAVEHSGAVLPSTSPSEAIHLRIALFDRQAEHIVALDPCSAPCQNAGMDGHYLTAIGAEAVNIADDPLAIREQLDCFAELVVTTQESLDEIANRGFLERLFSNNTRDLALAMNDIVTIQQMTLAFVIALVQVNHLNLQMLEIIRDELDDVRQEVGLFGTDLDGHQAQLLAFQSTLGQAMLSVEQQIQRVRDRDAAKRWPVWALWGAPPLAAHVLGLVLKAW